MMQIIVNNASPVDFCMGVWCSLPKPLTKHIWQKETQWKILLGFFLSWESKGLKAVGIGFHDPGSLNIMGFLRGGGPRGGGNWGTLRIPREDWGSLGNIRED